MGQVSSKLRRGVGSYFHWCPACEEMHHLPDSWSFDGNLESPTFTPSFRQEGHKRVFTNRGSIEDWKQGVGETVPYVCHYVLTAGVLNFCGDCTHSMAGQSVPLPALPEKLTDN